MGELPSRARDKQEPMGELPWWASTRQASMSRWTLPSASLLTNQRPVFRLTSNQMPGTPTRDPAVRSAMLA